MGNKEDIPIRETFRLIFLAFSLCLCASVVKLHLPDAAKSNSFTYQIET